MYGNRSEDIPHKSIHTKNVEVFRRYNVSDLIKDKSQSSNWENLVSDLMYIIDKVQRKIIVTPHIYFDWHVDHKLSTIALFEAIQKSKLKKGKIYLYDNHHVLSESYPFGPAHTVISLPPWFEDPVPIRSIYSLALSPEQQFEKLFALDAQHDLRELATINDYSIHWLIRNIKQMFLDYYEFNVKHKDISYLRRAIRSNELYFVVDFADINSFQKKYVENIHRAENKHYN